MAISRRQFLSRTLAGAGALQFWANASAHSFPSTGASLKISLAQWSLHRAFRQQTLDPANFAAIARNTYQLDAVEYVSGFYMDRGGDEKFWLDMRRRSESAGVRNLLIMVDDEGDLGTPNEKERSRAVENHYKWVHAAHLLGCHSMRVNAFGTGDRASVRAALLDGMSRLADYAAKTNINVIIENHGLFSSDGKLIAGIISESGRPNLGTLPDFGNWCTSHKWGSSQEACDSFYDRYEGVADLLPFARGVSAKSYDFDASGNETRIDYLKMIKLVKASGFTGHIGIEYEGNQLSEPDGIRATRALLEKAWKQATE